jgi:hypothetical protein
MTDRIFAAVLRCRALALSVFLTYVLSSSVGIYMAHAGNRFALAQRDRIVGVALHSEITTSYRAGHKAEAAALDCAGALATYSTQRSLRRSRVSASHCPTSR